MKILIKKVIIDFFYTLLSVYKILRFAKWNKKYCQTQNDKCIILGNGPSLKVFLEKQLKNYKNISKICVNNMALDKHYEILCPELYILADPNYFSEKVSKKLNSDRLKLVEALIKKTSWKMTLFIPYLNKRDTKLFEKFNQNKNIKVFHYNGIAIEGFKRFEHFCFKYNLGTPGFQNVLGCAIYWTINWGYKEIFLVGAEHSWTENILVNEENVLLRCDKHFYDSKNPDLIPIFKDTEQKDPFLMHEFMYAMFKTFKQYHILADYAKVKNTKIYNSTEVSYIDAFERKKL